MIIDAHCHFWEEELMSNELKNIIIRICNQYEFEHSMLMNGTAERLIKEMDEAGIDKTVLLSLDYEFRYTGKVGYQYVNNYLANIIEEYPNRIIGFAGIDPRRGKEAIKELERCVDELGFKGVKLWPLTGFYPDDPKFYPFYERMQEFNAIILCHTGTCPPGGYLKYCNPIYIDKLAIDFPDLKIIMAHMGRPWSDEAIQVATNNPNVYFDVSTWQPIFKTAPIAFIQTLVQAKLSCGIEKILFGTDWPLYTPMMSNAKWVKAIKKLKIPQALKLMGKFPEFTEDDKNKILGENAAGVLGL
ncbi:MAG: amidohydrolase family protein [Candidatus Lokiarchaeota archaeon]|nr:amidohydrolase family protein [Candidatus Lokiarchaeota archaeon]